MATYRVLVKSYINHSIVEEGAIVEYDGEPAENLEPIDRPVVEVAAAREKARKDSKARQAAAVATGDPSAADSLA